MCDSPLLFTSIFFTMSVLLSGELLIWYVSFIDIGLSFTVHLIVPTTESGRLHVRIIFCQKYHLSAVERLFCSESKIH